MFETSGDVLNLVLSVCIVALTFFLCWGIYYFLVAVQKWYRITKKIEHSVDEVEDIIETVKDKLHGSAAYLLTLGDVAKKIFEFVRDKREDYQEKKNDKTEKNKSSKSKIKNKK